MKLPFPPYLVNYKLNRLSFEHVYQIQILEHLLSQHFLLPLLLLQPIELNNYFSYFYQILYFTCLVLCFIIFLNKIIFTMNLFKFVFIFLYFQLNIPIFLYFQLFLNHCRIYRSKIDQLYQHVPNETKHNMFLIYYVPRVEADSIC